MKLVVSDKVLQLAKTGSHGLDGDNYKVVYELNKEIQRWCYVSPLDMAKIVDLVDSAATDALNNNGSACIRLVQVEQTIMDVAIWSPYTLDYLKKSPAVDVEFQVTHECGRKDTIRMNAQPYYVLMGICHQSTTAKSVTVLLK